MDITSLLRMTLEDESMHSSIFPRLEDNCIRLLTILPADDTNELCCQSSQFSFDELPTYTALSYAWGAGLEDCPINLNGHRLYIGKNLWRFLHCARAAKDTRFGRIWIDALCINQLNSIERTEQVSYMGDIFKSAERVVAWLGPSYNGSDQAMRNINTPLEYWLPHKKFFKIWTSAKGRAIHEICVRRYWTRLWIFQELVLAQRIQLMCGDEIIPWTSFESLLFEIDRRTPPVHIANGFEYESVRSSFAMSVVREISQHTHRTSLVYLMFATQHLRCSEIRDRVYALLSVAGSGSFNIRPDYHSSIPQLLNLVLRNQHEAQPPDSLEQVMSQCRQLTGLLGCSVDSIFHWNAQEFSPVPTDYEVTNSRLEHLGSPVSLWWTFYWRHIAVTDLLFKEKGSDIDLCFLEAVRSGHVATVGLLLEIGRISTNTIAQWQYTQMLNMASENGHLGIVEMLIEHGAEVNTQGPYNALYAASRNGHLGIAKMLIERAADVNPQVIYYTLHAASQNGHSGVVEMLIERAADVSPQLMYNALHAASENGHLGIVEMLIERAVDIHFALESASSHGHGKIVKMLIDLGLDVNNDAGYKALYNASREGHVDIVKMLLGRGAGINRRYGDVRDVA